MTSKKNPSVAIIGSFYQWRYQEVCRTVGEFKELECEVRTPTGARVLDEEQAFVRLASDDVGLSDQEIQEIATQYVLAADLVYVVAPRGYVGRATCYEIGRAMQAEKVIFYSERPADLPVAVSRDQVCLPVQAVRRWRKLRGT